jgi:HEAT repeat protein
MGRELTRLDVVSRVGYGLGALSRAVVEFASVPRDFVRALRSGSNGAEPRELLGRIADTDPAARADAIAQISKLDAERASSLLAEGLVDPDPKIRADTAGAAADLGALNLVFDLVLRLRDPELSVRRAAKSAIERLSGEAIDFEPQADEPAIARKVESIQRWWQERRYLDLRSSTEEGA